MGFENFSFPPQESGGGTTEKEETDTKNPPPLEESFEGICIVDCNGVHLPKEVPRDKGVTIYIDQEGVTRYSNNPAIKEEESHWP